MPDGTDWGVAWIRLERAIQKKIQKFENIKDGEETDYREVAGAIETLEEVQDLMVKYEPREHKRARLGTRSEKA